MTITNTCIEPRYEFYFHQRKPFKAFVLDYLLFWRQSSLLRHKIAHTAMSSQS